MKENGKNKINHRLWSSYYYINSCVGLQAHLHFEKDAGDAAICWFDIFEQDTHCRTYRLFIFHLLRYKISDWKILFFSLPPPLLLTPPLSFNHRIHLSSHLIYNCWLSLSTFLLGRPWCQQQQRRRRRRRPVNPSCSLLPCRLWTPEKNCFYIELTQSERQPKKIIYWHFFFF